MKSPASDKFKRINKFKSGLLSKIRNNNLNENTPSKKPQSHPHPAHRHPHPHAARHQHHAKPVNLAFNYKDPARIPLALPHKDHQHSHQHPRAGTEYRLKFRGRLWKQRFSKEMTAAALLAEGFERVDLALSMSDRLSNGVVPPRLSPPLESVLFSPGTHLSKNFSPWWRKVPVGKIDLTMLPNDFKPPSMDENLHGFAKEVGCSIAASTSSVTGSLAQVYFLFAREKGVYLPHLPTYAQKGMQFSTFSPSMRKPSMFYIRKVNGVFTIDNQSVVQSEKVLIELGHSIEIFLTQTEKNFKEILLNDPNSTLIQGSPFAFFKLGNLLIRSQLDAHHPSLPFQYFDVKTRATFEIRINLKNYKEWLGKHITSFKGLHNSFEKEFYDMSRGAFLKYYFQARIGNMDGIFVAYHNTVNFYGYEYLSLKEMEDVLFENSTMSHNAYHVCMTVYQKLINVVIDQCYSDDNVLRVLMKAHGRSATPELLCYVDHVPIEHDRGWSGSAIAAETPTIYNVRKFVVSTYVEIDGKIAEGELLIQEGEEAATYLRIREDTESPQLKLVEEYRDLVNNYIHGENHLHHQHRSSQLQTHLQHVIERNS